MTMTFSEFQRSVRTWILECFGSEISDHKQERNQRFLEESLELVQSCGMSRIDAHWLVDYVYSRPTGYKDQEIGGTLVTLAALCGAHQIHMGLAAEHELQRIQDRDVVEKIRIKQATKPRSLPSTGCNICNRPDCDAPNQKH
jgi:hypothetical protein